MPPPTSVTVAQVRTQQHRPVFEYVGRLEAVDDAAIQAQVKGYLQSAHFVEGDVVEKGALLFVIEPSSYEAALAAAKAGVSQAKALLEEARLNYNRGIKLVKQGAISKSEMDTLTSRFHTAEADLKSMQAKQKSAAIDLGHTRITAPFKGRVGRKKFSIGDLVSASSQDPLTTIVSIDPIYATFQVNSATYSEVAAKNREAKRKGLQPATFTAKLKLSSGDIYEESGKLDFVSNRIDSDTDSIMIRAKFANSGGFLRPGQYVRVLIEMDQPEDVLTIPQSAIISGQEGDTLFLVEADNTVKSVKVETGTHIKGNVIIKGEGINEKSRVVTGGVQRLKSGQKVKAVDDSIPATQSLPGKPDKAAKKQASS